MVIKRRELIEITCLLRRCNRCFNKIARIVTTLYHSK